MDVRELLPCDTRALHSMTVCPACKPLILKVNAGPLVVLLFPLLPTIATIKFCSCGPLIANTGSLPKRPVTLMLLTSNKPRLYEHVNSVLLYPSLGTLFKLTVTRAVSPTSIICGSMLFATYGPVKVGVGETTVVGVAVAVGVGKTVIAALPSLPQAL